MWLVANILGNAALEQDRFLFFPLAGGHREGMEALVPLDRISLSSPPERRESGVQRDCLQHKRVCIYRRLLNTTCTLLLILIGSLSVWLALCLGREPCSSLLRLLPLQPATLSTDPSFCLHTSSLTCQETQ